MKTILAQEKRFFGVTFHHWIIILSVLVCVRRQTGHWLGQEVAGVCRQRTGRWASLINLLQTQTRKEGGSPGCSRGKGHSIDPLLGQESSYCQPLIKITINQESIEQPAPKIEWKSTWELAVNRVSTESWLTARRLAPSSLRPPEAGSGSESCCLPQGCVS